MSRRTKAGFTLAESLAASVILAVAVVGVSGALIASQQQSGVQRRTHALTMLAQQLMERVTALPMMKSDGTTGASGWPTNKNATQYDTLDDYNGFSDVVDGFAAMETRSSNAPALNMSDTAPASLTVSQATAAGGTAITRSVSITYPTTAFGMPTTLGDIANVNVTLRVGTKDSLTLTKTVCRWTAARSG